MRILERLVVENYRCLRRVAFDAGDVNVFFGPNGVGKSTFLDALWFVRDCAINGTDNAASARHHGIGALADDAGPGDEQIRIQIETANADYLVTFGYSSGRIEPFVGERLRSKSRQIDLIQRSVGSDQARLYQEELHTDSQFKLPDPLYLAVRSYWLAVTSGEEVQEIDSLFRAVRHYASREIDLVRLRRLGSDTMSYSFPLDRWQNLWSALRNLHDRRAQDDRYATVVTFMRRAFPDSFRDLIFEQIGADRVGASFIEKRRREPIRASGVSDGHLQLLGLLTCLFGDHLGRPNLVLFDEPETSLHPHAIAVFAEAAREAASNWARQVFISTHSPVLISQFDPPDVIVASRQNNGATELRRVSDLPELADLVGQYALGSLYMAEELGRQSAAEVDAPETSP